ncbi:4Fe-4S binding protein [Methanobrevibacter curvatus]|uniref:Ferredoxin n=1 Tax=Methanobrevibacter curvatus TaxID=49547 RepID=A0A166AXH8_9EURY|nr:4Fe-4S binding protein [Methanobrevibacter curvatus]KZX12598.1 ferredoxin [Methanobrevibacter curvatus]
MSSIIWYLYEFARKAWVEGFFNAKSELDIVEKPDRFRDFPDVVKENCIGCGACTLACPSPLAIKLIRDKDEDKEGLTYPEIDNRACIRCGFCAEVCPSKPKTIYCGENHLIEEPFNIVPSKRKYMIDDFLCIKCKECMNICQVNAIGEKDNKFYVDDGKCISCGDCLNVCPVKGAMKGIFLNNLEEQKSSIKFIVNKLEKYIESMEQELFNLPDKKILKLELPLLNFHDEIIEKISDEEIAFEVVENTINRLKINIILWDYDKCNQCKLCVDECPTGAIKVDSQSNTVKRNAEKCLRCSICYQTCPFGVVKYFVAKFFLEKDENYAFDSIIKITVKASQLAQWREY